LEDGLEALDAFSETDDYLLGDGSHSEP
jgi:hypothetical protein